MTGLAHNAVIVHKETFVPILYVLKFKVSLSLSLSESLSLISITVIPGVLAPAVTQCRQKTSTLYYKGG